MDRQQGKTVLGGRNLSLDVVRIVALLCVIMIHCSGGFVENFKVDPVGFVVGNVADSVSRVAVPLFLMASGALMLDETRQKTTGDMLRAIKRLAIVTVLWSVIYAAVFEVISPLLKNESLDVIAVLETVIGGRGHMWYLYVQMGLYLATPFLRQFVKKQNKNLVLLFLAVAVCAVFVKPLITIAASVWPALSYIKTFIGKFNLDFFSGYVAYYLAGWYVVHVGVPRKAVRGLIYALGGLSVIGIIGLVHVTKEWNTVYSNKGLLVFLYSVSLFLFLNNLSLQKCKRVEKGIVSFSKLSFGIYIIHAFWDTVAATLLKSVTNSLIHIPVRFLLVLAISFASCYLLSKIPVVKKLIRM